ncbi:Ig-like domain-containing protein [Curtobacterium sp. RRHDQ66]|uniref:Ig-like domain-containing protein n=1 Tax=Curtobacterium guangdongense TaxID=3413380 RepID=UPI003BEF9306
MRAQDTAGTTRRRQRTLAAALGVVLAIAAVVIPSAPANAMTQVGPVPSGVPGAQVVATVQNQTGGTGNWTITAPPQTRITAAATKPGTGLAPFTCTPSADGTSAACGNLFWGAPNTVDVQLVIDADATLGTKTGSSAIVPVDPAAPYSITVVAPAAPGAPTITAPGDGSESIAAQPTITGTKTAGNAASVALDGVQLCSPPADATTTWSCDPSDPLTVGEHTVTATQTDRFGQVSPTATSTFTVLAPAAFSITQSGAERLIPTQPATRTVTIANGGDGEARGVVFTAGLGGFPATTCRVGSTAVDCAALPSGVPVGTIAPGASATVTITGAAPTGTAPGTSYLIATSAASTTASVSPVDSDGSLEVVAPPAPGFTQPVAGSSTPERRPGIFGNGAVGGGRVTVMLGPTVVCAATAGEDGIWSCTADQPLPYGSVTLTVTEAFGGLTSAAGSRTFTVLRPVVPAPPGGSVPPPSAGSGPAGGGSTAPTGPAGPAGGGSAAGGGVGSGSPGGSAPAPSTPAPSAPAPSTPGSGSGSSDGDGSGGGTGGDAGAGSGNGALPMDLRFGTQRIMPGTVADMRGTLGPNGSGATVAITFSARMSTGMVYRNVDVAVDEEPVDCSVATTTFSCLIPLDPGKQADVAIRVFADAVNAPDTAVQQIQVASNRSSQANAMTVTTAVAKGETEASQLADQITTFNVTEFPGAMVPLLAMLLFALAATVAGRRSTGGSPTAPVATGPPTGADPPGGTTASSPIRPDDQSGSNR